MYVRRVYAFRGVYIILTSSALTRKRIYYTIYTYIRTYSCGLSCRRIYVYIFTHSVIFPTGRACTIRAHSAAVYVVLHPVKNRRK